LRCLFSRPSSNPDPLNPVLTDKKFLLDNVMKAIPRGLILINGDPKGCDMFCEAMQNCAPVFIFKHTGGCADLAIEMLEKVDKWLSKKRVNASARPEQPFKVDIPDGYQYNHPWYAQPFNEYQVDMAKTLNILIENFPDRYNPSTVLRIDMFKTSEERLQDQLTKTMAVVFEGVAELGGQSAETRRLTYAWRLVQLLSHNAKRQKLTADALNGLLIIITLAATCSAVVWTYLQVTSLLSGSAESLAQSILFKFNLLLPLAATIIRGINAALNPLAKWSALIGAKMSVEAEIYMYRTKVGDYNTRKATKGTSNQGTGGGTSGAADKKNKGDEKKKVKTVNPRKVFSEALDAVWLDLSASSISTDSLVAVPKSQVSEDEHVIFIPLPLPLGFSSLGSCS